VKVVVFGAGGQLGRALSRRAGQQKLRALGRNVDVTNAPAVGHALDEHRPDAVINAAAYTAVDRAEAECDRAFVVNVTGADIVARECAKRGVRMLHVSTDYVFDGVATRPYRENDPIAPVNAYGVSKAVGEDAVRAAGGIIVRTSWLFGEGGPSFVHSIVRLATERTVLRVVADQYGCPTWADDLADALLMLAEGSSSSGTYHYCNSGPTTRHAFALTVVEDARRYRRLACERVEPITTAEHPTPARRPLCSVLDTSRIAAVLGVPPSWRVGLSAMLAQELGA
jgi:dTDP-4-dehydrorhamnose reductase